MLRVGLTGGIAAGKSAVSARLAELGAALADADKIAREVVRPGSAGLTAVAAEFGPDVLAPDGSLDRPALGAVVFGDEVARKRLNAITHPLIAARTAELMAAVEPDAIFVHDVPLLVENRLAAGYHLVVVVEAPDELRIARMVADRGMTADAARARIAAQAGDADRRAVADILLVNDGPLDTLLSSVSSIWNQRLVRYAANLRERRPADGDATPDDAACTRITARLRLLLGERAVAIVPADGGIRLVATGPVEDLLAAGGWFPDGSGAYRSADPGLPVTLQLSAG